MLHCSDPALQEPGRKLIQLNFFPESPVCKMIQTSWGFLTCSWQLNLWTSPIREKIFKTIWRQEEDSFSEGIFGRATWRVGPITATWYGPFEQSCSSAQWASKYVKVLGTNLPYKTSRNPKGKDRLPTTIFPRRLVGFREVYDLSLVLRQKDLPRSIKKLCFWHLNQGF